MTQQIINIGSAELKGDGESIRSAFNKVNSNFTEIYGTSYTGNISFTGTIMHSSVGLQINNQGTSTGATAFLTIPPDAGANVGIQNNYGTVTITSGADPGSLKTWTFTTSGSLTAPGDVIPTVNLSYDLGSVTHQWRSLYVGTSTIYIGGVPLSINTLTNTLIVGTNSNISSTSTNIATEKYVIDYVTAINTGSANLGDFKIHSSAGGSTLGTVDNPNTGGWGGYDIYIDSGGGAGSNAKIYIPSVVNQAVGTSLQIVNNGTDTSIIQLFGRGGVQLVTNTGGTEKIFEFGDAGVLIFPDGTSQNTAYTGGGGSTSTLVAGTATLSISTLSETVLPSGLTFEPIENYGFGFGGTIAMQTYGEQLQVLATGTGAFGLFGYGEVIGGPGGVAYLVGNQDGTNEVKIVAGSYNTTVHTWKFGGDGQLIIPDAILGSGDQALVIQNTASGVAYLELPVDPSADSVILANQAASSATVTIRVGDFGSEKDWTFDEFGALATPGIIYNTDTSNVGQLLLAGAPGEPATYLALPSDVGSTLMNVRLVNSNGNIQLTAGNNTWLYNDSGELTLPNGSMLFESSLIAASGTNAVLSQFDSNTQVYTMDYAVGVQTHNSGTYHTWLFNNTGDVELPGGSVLATSGYDVALVAGNDGTGTFGTVTISTQYPPDLTDRNWEFNSLGEFYLPLGGAIQETVVTNELWGTTTTSLTLVPAGAANGTQRLEIYSTGGGEGDHIHIRSGDQSQTDLFLGNDTQYFAVAASGANYIQARNGTASPSPGTSASAGANVNIYGGNAGNNGGNVADGNSGGDVFIASGISTAGLGGNIYLQTSSGPSGFGSVKLSTDGGSSYLEFDKDDTLTFPSGGDIQFDNSATSYIYGVTGIEFANATTQTTAWVGGGSSISNTTLTTINDVNTGDFQNTGSIAINYTAFNGDPGVNFNISYQSPLTTATGISVLGVAFPDSSIQTTAFTGTSALLDITNTNGIDTNYYITFVENRTTGQEVRADVDLTFNSWSNTLGAGNITVTSLLNLGRAHETLTTATTATSTVNYNCANSQIFFHTSTGTVANWTANFTNLSLDSGKATAINIVIKQGATGYYPSAVQIGGVAQTLNWQGNTNPTVSTHRTDVVAFTILNDSGTYTVLGQLTGF